MIRGTRTVLRARRDEDLPVLHRELYDDVATRSRADSRPWRPLPATGPEAPYSAAGPGEDVVLFSAVDAESGELVGEALLWGIDTYNRLAHLGISLRPDCRGTGRGTEIVGLLCHYGFTVRGLHRLQLETLAGNIPMITAAEKSGFTVEGRLRRSAWVSGTFEDEVVLGLLAADWLPHS
ncbi:GNAT family N-acetyltransferase [Streptomyces bambusae]|uniref:GNAT family N-acetyltransferase n=1 Tax=Streptomyces bambusae TaxID=1550616 RepID=UPI001CFDB057|nr:GNAT family protein [Streptomyces bambusae]MCB5169057.1 GNAT family N-acetyltransferase [Streptomyces bambusae]